jgi:16S rRNA (cytosine1402-N4)-methyltransferase
VNPSPHIPVLFYEVLETLDPRPGEVILDGTLGTASHASALLSKARPGGFLIGADQDSELLEVARKHLLRDGWIEQADFALIHSRFSRVVESVCQETLPRPHVSFFDLGINSHHVDESSRGFSFRLQGPLDMRLDQADSHRPTAAQLLQSLPVAEVARILRDLGDERFAFRIASAIGREQMKEPITTTGRLASIVSQSIPRKAWPPHTHPATRTFQALRMAVNHELEELEGLLHAVPSLVSRTGDRIGIIGFHSLELRPVKERFRNLAQPCTCPSDFPVCVCGSIARFRLLTKTGLGPSEEEVARNPRARSARFWALSRILPDPPPT